MLDEILKLVDKYNSTNLKLAKLETIKKTNKTKQELEELRQELIEIKFRLELPYKILDLLFEASRNDIRIDILGKENIINLFDYNSKDNSLYYLYLNNTQYEFATNEQFVEEIKERRLEEKHKQQLKQQALSKLTKEEIEVLGVN